MTDMPPEPMNIKRPFFEIASVYDDGEPEEPKIFPVTDPPYEMRGSRRGFLQAGLTLGSLLAFQRTFGSDPPATEPGTGTDPIKAHDGDVTSLAFSPDGKHLASCSKDGTVKLWSIPDGQPVAKPKGGSNELLSLCFSRDGRMLATTSAGGSVEIRSLPGMDAVRTLSAHSEEVTCAAFHPDGSLLFTGSRDNTVKRWSCADWKPTGTLPGHKSDLTALAIDHSGKLLASCAMDDAIDLITIEDNSLITSYRREASSALCAAFSPDMDLLATGQSDDTVAIWDLPQPTELLAQGKARPTWSLPPVTQRMALSGHKRDVRSVAFSPDGKSLFSGSDDGTIRIWQMPQGRSIAVLAQDMPVLATLSLSCSSEGRLLASGHSTGVIRLWNLNDRSFIGYLFDKSINQGEAITYSAYDTVTGQTITYTLPCGSPIPPGAVCTCNCVAGTFAPKAPVVRRTDGGTYCSCNKVCTCNLVYR